MIGANIGVSMPVFWLGLMLALCVCHQIQRNPFLDPAFRTAFLRYFHCIHLLTTFPFAKLERVHSGQLITFASNMVTFNALITGNFKVFRDALWHLILPCVAVGTIPLAIIARD